jgi:hypothetical protein
MDKVDKPTTGDQEIGEHKIKNWACTYKKRIGSW